MIYNFINSILNLLNEANDFLWTYIIIGLLIFSALYFTIRTRGVQFILFKDMVRIMMGSDKKKITTHNSSKYKDKTKQISSFGAFTVSLSSRVGTGNLAGVASAIYIGGPGAVFWMWIMALFGAATAFVESTLAQLYKRRGKDSFYGGPAYYMQNGLHQKWMGIVFAILITTTFGMAYQIIQSNTLCDSLSNAIGADKISIGAILTISILFIIFGGIRRITNFANMIVPTMTLGYLLLALYIVLCNINLLPSVFKLIIDGAFGLEQITGGTLGAAMMQGIKRGLFSNEAGEGSAPNAAAVADTSHPAKQGLVQALGVFVDTLIICTCTAFIILLSGVHTSGVDGILLTTKALESHVGVWGKYFMTAAIFLFAYSTIIGNYFYGEANIRFITKNNTPITIFRLITGGMIMIGAFVSLQTAWSFADIMMGLMTLFNLIAILLLSNKVFFLLHNYILQKKAGKEPEFHRNMMPNTEKDIECWD